MWMENQQVSLLPVIERRGDGPVTFIFSELKIEGIIRGPGPFKIKA
jgi:hypothetical protein